MEDDKLKQKVKTVFGQNAEKYVSSEIHAKGDDLPLLVEWLHPQSEWVVLDIATGGGHVTKTLAPYVSTVFSTDLTEKMLANTARHLNKHKNIWYVIADAEALPFLEGTFDLVTCRIAPHHFPNPNAFIQEVERVLKPGGKFVLIDNVAPEDKRLDEFMNMVEKLRDESHVRCLTIEEWRELFSFYGLKEMQSLNRKKTFQFPSWVARTATTKEQIENVQQYMLSANEDIKNYFSVIIENNQISSHQIDEWIVLCEKGR
ncbi:class I SAM-dependent methyltransferase [Anaerobacillus sp. CMMVII]|uniref:class I SAM-dependent methyltransferase n=1 Tax=Anaerobacillus sp. CMMVII TaxID=2755588 RepID=UPI0021B7367C|nr:class I SAM-dependent methyltransferase [Anaerobacillus sp. CMMVII]MCT8139186.1 class I SAM-dependent methyltransferase [Anaerobacillus sp. CMMVII]